MKNHKIGKIFANHISVKELQPEYKENSSSSIIKRQIMLFGSYLSVHHSMINLSKTSIETSQFCSVCKVLDMLIRIRSK